MTSNINGLNTNAKPRQLTIHDDKTSEYRKRQDLIWMLMLGVDEYNPWHSDKAPQFVDIPLGRLLGTPTEKLPEPFKTIVREHLMGKKVTVSGYRTDNGNIEQYTGVLSGITCDNISKNNRPLALKLRDEKDESTILFFSDHLRNIEIQEIV